jgi:hypothetical protein
MVMSVLKVGRPASLAAFHRYCLVVLSFTCNVIIAKFSRNFLEIKINFERSKAGQKYLSEFFYKQSPLLLTITAIMREA